MYWRYESRSHKRDHLNLSIDSHGLWARSYGLWVVGYRWLGLVLTHWSVPYPALMQSIVVIGTSDVCITKHRET